MTSTVRSVLVTCFIPSCRGFANVEQGQSTQEDFATLPPPQVFESYGNIGALKSLPSVKIS